jgi:hypothetical protein
VAALAALGGADVERREFLTATGTVLGLLSLPGNPAHATPTAPAKLAHTGTVHVGATEVNAIRTMTTAFGDAAAELGGGHTAPSPCATSPTERPPGCAAPTPTPPAANSTQSSANSPT